MIRSNVSHAVDMYQHFVKFRTYLQRIVQKITTTINALIAALGCKHSNDRYGYKENIVPKLYKNVAFLLFHSRSLYFPIYLSSYTEDGMTKFSEEVYSDEC